MKRFTPALLALSVAVPAIAADIKMDDQSQLTPKATGQVGFQPPLEGDLPDNAYGKLVQEGRAIFVDTQKYAADYVGNGMNCTNCHLDQGRKANSAPLWGAYPMYPAYRKMINALTAYSYWLSTGAPTGQELPGRAYPEVPQPKGGYDIAKGREVYAAQCAVCHGDDGQGQKAGDGYVFPPLWGRDSFNWGAGMHRINTAAAFIKENMPLGKGRTLSDEEAWNVAAFMNSHERPQDPRLIDGSIAKTREKYHANDGVNLYGVEVNGVLLGQGIK